MPTIPLSSDVVEYLEEKKIFLHRSSTNVRQLPTSLTFVDHLRMEPYTGIYAGANLATLGAFSYSNSPVNPYVSVGRYCSFSWGITVVGPRHSHEWLTTSNIVFDGQASNIARFKADNPSVGAFNGGDPRIKEKPFPSIGNDVWLGQNVTLNRGVHIGDGAVVAAFSVVTKDVPPYCIVGGNPAKIIRLRFPSEIVERLLACPWWDMPPDYVAKLDLKELGGSLDMLERDFNPNERYSPEVLTGSELQERFGSHE